MRRLFDGERMARAIEMRDMGFGNSAIGEALGGFTAGQVNWQFKRYAPRGNAKVRRARLLTDEQLSRAFQMREQGFTHRRIGEALGGFTKTQIDNVLNPSIRKRRDDPSVEATGWAQRIYGVGPERYAEMLSAQGGGCAICGATGGFQHGGRLHIDHDHACCPGGGTKTCGKCVRGLLCSRCNSKLCTPALAREFPAAVAAYLANPPAMAGA